MSSTSGSAESFFFCLPYDVRIVIYSYLAPPGTLLPPVRPYSPSTILGFATCCQQAKREMEEIGWQELSRWLLIFKKRFTYVTGLEVEVENTMDTFKCVSLALPTTAIHYVWPGIHRLRWRQEVIVALYPLLIRCFDVVRVHFGGQQDFQCFEYSGWLSRESVEENARFLLQDLSYSIQYMNADKPRRYRVGMGEVHMQQTLEYCQGPNQRESDSRIRAKRICLSWSHQANHGVDDSTPSDNGNDTTLLRGMMVRHEKSPHAKFHGRNHSRYYRITRVLRRHTERSEMILDDIRRRDASKSMCDTQFYHLEDKHGLMGEMGLMSETRWKGGTDKVDLVSLVNKGLETVAVRVESMGLGQELVRSNVDEDLS